MKNDNPKPGTVPMDSAFVKQHRRLAAGVPCNGQKMPSAPATPNKNQTK